MKKLSLLFVAVMACAFMANAQHQVGAIVGTFEGVSYKYFLTENWAIQADLGFKVIATGKGSDTYLAKETYDGETEIYNSIKEDAEFKKENPDAWKEQKEDEKRQKYGTKGWTLELNPNLVYQNIITDFGWGDLSWFAGAGLSLGFGRYTNSAGEYVYEGETYPIKEGDYDRYGDKDEHSAGPFSGKFGLNAIGGVELGLSEVPLVFALDFRPGYGLFFDHESEKEDGYKYSGNQYYHIFDWTLGLSVRYCL